MRNAFPSLRPYHQGICAHWLKGIWGRGIGSLCSINHGSDEFLACWTSLKPCHCSHRIPISSTSFHRNHRGASKTHRYPQPGSHSNRGPVVLIKESRSVALVVAIDSHSWISPTYTTKGERKDPLPENTTGWFPTKGCDICDDRVMVDTQSLLTLISMQISYSMNWCRPKSDVPGVAVSRLGTALHLKTNRQTKTLRAFGPSASFSRVRQRYDPSSEDLRSEVLRIS